VAGLEGHVSRSAVYLIHIWLGRRRAEEGWMNPRASPATKKDAITRGV